MVDKAQNEAATAAITDSRPKSQALGTSGKDEGETAARGEMIKVRSLRTFHKEAGGKGDLVKPGDEFETTRDRAMQLRQNGLIEYPEAEHENKLHGESAARAMRDRHEHDAAARKLPDNAKTTPLRNPEVKLADVKDKSER